jgi:serine/threonine protein kinase
MPLSSRTRLGPYEITAPLGAGGMGEVYRANDLKLGRAVALKVLSPGLAGDADYMARFTREAQVLASLNHPNIAAIYGLEESDGVRALVMELVEGPTLAERIAAGALPLEETLSIARQVADALEAAHEKGIVHRDLKPANVKITPEGVVKVLDFGLAKAPEQSASISASSPTLTMRATQAGVIMGTAAYMSPEQASAKPVDKRADIWSFGVVFFEMLTGKSLFHGDTVAHTLADVLRGEINLDRLPSGTSPAIFELLGRCLDRDVKTRLRDIGEARIAIQKYLTNPHAPAAPARRVSWLPWAIAAVLTAALLAVALYREAPPLPRPVSRWSAMLPVADAVAIELSRDGTLLVNGGAGGSLTLRMLDRGETKRLTGAGGSGPTFSPDGHWIVYYFLCAKRHRQDIVRS